MPALGDIRKKRMEELMKLQQDKMQQQAQEQAQVQQQIEYIENVVRNFLTKEALARYGNLKAAHREKALQLLVGLFQSIQRGQVKTKINDLTLKKVLEQLTPKKKEIKIKRV